MDLAITILIVTALLAYAAGKLLEDPTARITQGLIALIGAVFIVVAAGWL